MNIPDNLKKAIGSFNWVDVQTHFEGFPSDKLRAEIELVLDVILRDGYLILRRPDPAKATGRSSFMAAFRNFAAVHGADGLFGERASRIEGASLTELVYQELLSSVRTHVLSRLAPDVFIWAVLRKCELLARDLNAAIQSHLSAASIVDPVAMRVLVASAGGDVNPDELLDSIMLRLTATIKMLAYELEWFAEDGVIDIPAPAMTAVLPDEVVRTNHFLAEAWSLVERSEGRCRYFGGSVTEAERRAGAGAGNRVKVVRFEFPDAGEVGICVAGERMKHMFLGFIQGLDQDPGIQAKLTLPGPTPLAPDGLVSLYEANAAIALTHILFKWVEDVKEEYAGLTVFEWLRGYSLIQKLGSTHLRGARREVYAVYTPRFLEEVLSRAGLSLEKAKIFIRNVTFGKDAADVFDAPLLRCTNGTFFLVAPAVAVYNPALVIMSRLVSLQCNLSWKGKTLEDAIVGLFRKQGIPAAAIKRRIGGQECEVDCVVLWDGVLFVFECKNYSLPGDNAPAEFWFTVAQASAARQAKSKAEVLSRYPEAVAEELGVSPDWMQVIPVVLNGTPYALPGPIDGVRFYDASALHRFFEQGQIGFYVGDKPVPERTIALWAGEHPSANDLLKQLTNPAQEALIREYFARSDVEFPISKRLVVSTIRIERRPTAFETVVPESRTGVAT
jgi:hypothetical protein